MDEIAKLFLKIFIEKPRAFLPQLFTFTSYLIHEFQFDEQYFLDYIYIKKI